MEQKYQESAATSSWLKNPWKLVGKYLKRLAVDVRGQDQVEYAVLVGLIALVAALSLPALANRINDVFEHTEEVLQDAKKGNCANPNPGNFQGRSPCAP